MNINLSQQSLPQVFIRNGRECYLDPIRKKLIYITPEETVRQQVVSYLLNDLKVPNEMIVVEEHLSHYGIDSIRRADIVIKAITDKDELLPIAVIECKAPGIGLGAKTEEQMIYYSEALGCDYAMMINDTEYFCYHYEVETGKYIQIESLPTYTDMLSDNFIRFETGEIPDRIPFENISAYLKDSLDEYSPDISHKTKHSFACAGFNLLEGLLDTKHKMPVKQYGIFRLIEDYGVRMLSYGNAGGGDFFAPYRSFLIEYNGSTEFVSIGFSAYCRSENPNNIKTAINVAIDNEKESHHSLQFSIDDNLVQNGDSFTFYHHGRIAVGNKGSGKVNDLQRFVEKQYPKIISGNRFDLGTLVNNRLWHLDDPKVVNVLENFISYALLRDDYRHFVKQSNKE